MRIAGIGADAMGRWAVKELAINPEVDELFVGAYHEEQARAVAAAQGGGKAQAVFADARDAESVKKAIAGCDAMVNATQHFWNINVMHAASAAEVHDTDMGGLFHVTKQQVELAGEFEKAGVTAVIAMGAVWSGACAPPSRRTRSPAPATATSTPASRRRSSPR